MSTTGWFSKIYNEAQGQIIEKKILNNVNFGPKATMLKAECGGARL